MKKIIVILLIICMSFSLVGCAYRKVTITDPRDYHKIETLPEIRDREALEIFPESIKDKDVDFFYFRWDLGIIGCASVEYQLSVKYNETEFEKEYDRIKNYRGEMVYLEDDGERCIKEPLVYDDENFCLPAYVAVLGHNSTNAYVLVDKENKMMHYMYLCVLEKDDLHINRKYLPNDYCYFGTVPGLSYSIYEEV